MVTNAPPQRETHQAGERVGEGGDGYQQAEGQENRLGGAGTRIAEGHDVRRAEHAHGEGEH